MILTQVVTTSDRPQLCVKSLTDVTLLGRQQKYTTLQVLRLCRPGQQQNGPQGVIKWGKPGTRIAQKIAELRGRHRKEELTTT